MAGKKGRREPAGTERSMVGTSRLIRGVFVPFADEKIDFGISKPVTVTSKFSSTESSWSSSVKSARSRPAFSASLLSAIMYARI